MGGPFGIRRPLRFLAHKLELDEEQIASLAEILDDLKTECAQREVDERRTQKLYAEALIAEPFDAARAKQAAAEREASARKVEEAVVDALSRLHAVLDADQRKQLVVMIRTGMLSL